MPFNILLAGVMMFQILAVGSEPISGRAAITAANNQAVIAFPNKITFQVDLDSSVEITSVTLEYGVQQITCGKLVAKSFPDFEPAKKVSAAWSWEMKQSGSLPPGAKIWWRWNVTDASGSTLVTDEQNIIWLDDVHSWKTLTQGDIHLHWYQGDETFGQELLDNGVQSLEMLEQNIGLKPDGAIDLFIYASSDELTEAVYFMPDWTGGLAYSENNIVLIGIAESDLTWGKHAETHELTHVLVGRLTFSCLGDLPTWLNEGLADYAEGDWDENARRQLQEAIDRDELISVRALSSSFPEDADKARQAYSQSKSLVTLLIDEYQQDKLLQLLNRLSHGATTDEALVEIYGFDQDGLEDAWREKVGAKLRAAVQTAPTVVLTPTLIPTIVPVSDVPAVITISPPRSPTDSGLTPTRTPLFPANADEDEGRSNMVWLIYGVSACAVAMLVIVAVVIVFALKNKKG